ncbi:MAG: calcium/sodium antiporter [Oscillospiraceae bacterium]|nr:calcium/sodium antiporter [Oscillospiraceae bacterium]
MEALLSTDTLWQACLWLVLGFVLLVKGADFFVDGSSSVAKMLKVPSLIIGLTIVAMGTSLPECSVSVTAALAHNNELAIANAVGSNIINLMVVCGVCAVLCPMAVQKSMLLREYPLSVGAAVLLLIFGLTGWTVGHVEGAILLVIFAVFLVWMVRSAMKARKEGADAAADEDEPKTLPIWQCILFIIGGAAAIVFGGDRVVDAASSIAIRFGMSQNLVGLTIVALGTSLPELVTSAVAARKKEVDMALGNVVGSNIFNILMVLGVSGAISPMSFTGENAVDIIVLMVFSAIVWVFCWPKKQLARWGGAAMLLMYAAYVVYICMR